MKLDPDIVFTAYIEAIYFTDTGEEGQPAADAELTPRFLVRARLDCYNFCQALSATGWARPENVEDDFVGYDLWFTRNHYGVGFWDSPDIYGEEMSDILTAMARAMGVVDSEWL